MKNLNMDELTNQYYDVLKELGNIGAGNDAAFVIQNPDGTVYGGFQLHHDALKNTVGHFSGLLRNLHKSVFHKIYLVLYTPFAQFASAF